MLAQRSLPQRISNDAFWGVFPSQPPPIPLYVWIGITCVVCIAILFALVFGLRGLCSRVHSPSSGEGTPSSSSRSRNTEPDVSNLMDGVSTAAFRGAFEPLRILSHTPRSTVFEVAHRKTHAHFAIKQIFIYNDVQYRRAQNEVDKIDLCAGIPGVLRMKQSSMYYPMSHAASGSSSQRESPSHSKSAGRSARRESETRQDNNSINHTQEELHSDSVVIVEREPLLASPQDDKRNLRIMTIQTQYCKGGNLTHYVDDKQTPIPWLTVGTWVLSLAATLKRMHSLRCGTIVHCDVCTDNVLLNGEEVVLGGLSSAILQNEDLSSPVFAADVEAPTTVWTAP